MESAVPIREQELRRIPPGDLTPHPRNSKIHRDNQIEELRRSLRRFGLISPIVVDEELIILAGHGMVKAALAEHVEEVPTVIVSGLTADEKRAYLIADNRLAEKSKWNWEMLHEELGTLAPIMDLKDIGFEDQVIAHGDGVTSEYRLARAYASGGASYSRPITKPVLGTVKIGVQRAQMVESIHFTVDYATGMISFEHPPEEDVEISAGFEFDVPVRFDTDRIQTSVASFQAGDVPNVPVVEVRI